jgi:UDP-GlcNAc:undecaprenyl-phosphate/decaprenyl-phosphate GlcNAc-1-phosphate transferase
MQVAIFVLTFMITLVFLLTLRPVAAAMGLVDFPGGRKTHDVPIPVIGGVCMSIGVGFGAMVFGHPPSWEPILLGVYVLVVVGTIDDRFDLPPNVRFVAQACAALLLVYGAGIRVTSLGSPLFFPAPLGVFSVPFTLVFIVTLINAFNFSDGIDGLAGGLALISLISMGTLAGGTDALSLIVLLTAAIAAFLVCNFPFRYVQPIRTFMGDAGSTSLGLMIAAVGISLSQGDVTERSPVIGLWLVAVPVFELFCSIVRRVRDGKSPLKPDHEHLHHALIAGGLSRSTTLVVMLALAAFCATLGVVASTLGVADGVMLIAWLAAGTAYYQMLRRAPVVLRSLLPPRTDLRRSRDGAAQPNVQSAET